ncbi:MAG: PhnD/SsuA/transferrin family substrate-binding protein [Polyangiales bacterium]
MMKAPIRLAFVPTTRLLTQRSLLARWSAATQPTEWVPCSNYAELLRTVTERTVDAAWLPPVTYLRAVRTDAVEPVFSLKRAGAGRYSSALICHADTPYEHVDDLRDARAAWVDPWSAAGYLMPRKLLREAGVHPDRDIWQRMFGSYSNVLEALALDRADIAGVFCSVDAFKTVIRAGWTGADRVRVIALSEPIAGDVIARVRRKGAPSLDEWTDAVRGAAEAREHQSLLRDVFGAEGLEEPDVRGYAPLESALRDELSQ